MPKKLTPLQREQWRAWGWYDTRARAKQKWFHTLCEGEPALTGDTGEEAMSLGNRKTSTSAFDPVLKIDCRAGKVTRCDRKQIDGEWQTEPVDIPIDDFEAVIDLSGLKIGWLHFGSPPDFQLYSPGEDIGEQPSDKHKEGFKVRLLLRNGAGSGVHELASTAAVMWQSMDELHDSWEDEKGKHKGKAPVIGIAEMIEVQTRSGTSYRPSFEILSWVNVPPEFAAVQTKPKPAAKKHKAKPADDEYDEDVTMAG
jgi:hypothetical protein